MKEYASAPAAAPKDIRPIAPPPAHSRPDAIGARPTVAEPVIQRAKDNRSGSSSGKSLDDIAKDVRNVQTLSSSQIARRLRHLREHQRTLHFADPRVRRVEELTHVLSRQQLARSTNRPHMLTRLLSPHQLQRPNIGINSVRTSRRSLRRNLGTQLSASGGGTTDLKRLYAFMRRNGRAGFQGFHRDLGNRNRNIHGIIRKLGVDPGRGASQDRGAKFVLAAVDRRRLQAQNVYDTNDAALRARFEQRYKRPVRGRKPTMYDNHAAEGVVAHSGNIPISAVTGIRAFRGAPLPGEGENAAEHEIMSMEEVEDIAEGLLDQASSEPEPTFQPGGRFYRKPDDDNNGGDGIMA